MASAKDPGIVAYGDLIKAVAFRLLAADTHLIKARESKEGAKHNRPRICSIANASDLRDGSSSFVCPTY